MLKDNFHQMFTLFRIVIRNRELAHLSPTIAKYNEILLQTSNLPILDYHPRSEI
jgi:hypothetical protein